jgi:hypothetical protein
MSSLPPIGPQITPAGGQSPASAQAVRDARAQFFRALGEVPAATPAPVTAAVAPQRPAPAPLAAASIPASSGPVNDTDQAPRRPGSLINILV